MISWTGEALDTLARLREAGWSYGRIAEVLGVSHDAVKNAASRYGYATPHSPDRRYNRRGTPSQRPHEWGLVSEHRNDPDDLFAGQRFEDDPRAVKRERPLRSVGWVAA